LHFATQQSIVQTHIQSAGWPNHRPSFREASCNPEVASIVSETVVFGLEDSGEGNSTITYAAYPGEKLVFSSGQDIWGWKRVTAELPGLPAASGSVRVADVSRVHSQ